MTVVGLVGSPRRRGTTRRLVRRALEGAAAEGCRTTEIRLGELDILPCQACPRRPSGHCHFRDDMDRVYAALAAARGVILGSPLYFETVSAQVKLMVDRANCLMAERVSPEGRRHFAGVLPGRRALAFIAVSDLSRDFAGAVKVARTFGYSLNASLVDTLLVPGAQAGPEADRAAFDLGARLARAARKLEYLPVAY